MHLAPRPRASARKPTAAPDLQPVLLMPAVQRLLTRRYTDPAMKNKFVSTAQQLRNEGQAEARASTLLRLITKRFGDPDVDVVDRVHSGTNEQLDRWIDRILDAASLDELFAE